MGHHQNGLRRPHPIDRAGTSSWRWTEADAFITVNADRAMPFVIDVVAVAQPRAATGDFYLDLTHRTGTTRWLVPAGTQTLHLRSIATSRGHDLRRLGTAICGLRLDGYAITLDDPRLLSGFHDVEHEGGRRWRWTDAEAVINVATPVDVWLELDLFERSAAAAAA